MTSTLASASASATWARNSAVRSLRSSFVRMAHGTSSERSPMSASSSSSQGMPAVPLSTSNCISVLPVRNGSRSSGTSSRNSVRPICESLAAVIRRLADQRSGAAPACTGCARVSVRARLVSSV